VRRAHWILVGLAGAAAAAGVYVMSLPRTEADVSPRSSATAIARPPSRPPVPAPVAEPASVAPAPPAAVPASAPRESPGARALCDGGPQPLPDGAAREAALAERLKPQREALLRAAAAHDDPLVKALAAFRLDPAPAPADADGAAVSRARDALAQAAARDDDARLYALAWAACKRVPAAEAGACQLLSPRRWAHLAPGDARPWLELAATARERRDEAELREALYQVSQAQRLDSQPPAIGTLVLEALPPGLPRWSQMQLLRQALRQDQAARPSYAVVLQHCDRRPLEDPNRRPECAAIADLLQRDASTLADLRMAEVLGRRLGWPAARQQALHDELDGARRWLRQRGDVRALDCATVQRVRPELVTVLRLGELPALRLLQARSPAPAAAGASR
jgi:hypothetical protein